MSTTPNTVDLSTMTVEQKAELFSLLKKEEREAKTAKTRAAKYAKFEPIYSQYRLAVSTAKTAKDEKNRLLSELKKLGFGGGKPAKATTPTPKKKK